MNEDGCQPRRDGHEDVRFPDVPPIDLCRRHSCLDNFILSACVAKAADNLARLDQILRQQRLADTVKRSYRASCAARRRSEADGGGGGDSVWPERLARTGALMVDGRPPSGRLAQDVHGLLENLGTLVRRLEGDINKTWARTQQLEAATARVRRDMRRTSSGCLNRLESHVGQLWDNWHLEHGQLQRELQEARQQSDQMTASVEALQRRVGTIDECVQSMRNEGVAIGEEARAVFHELHELKRRLHETVRDRRQAARRAGRVREIHERAESESQLRCLQRSVRRKQLQEELQIVRRDVGVATSQQSVAEERLAEATADAEDAATQVTASLASLSRAASASGQALPPLEPGAASDPDAVYVMMTDAATQMQRRLAETRSQVVQAEIACRDAAVQIGKLHRAEVGLEQQRQQLEVEIAGVRISRICSVKQLRHNTNIISRRCVTARRQIQESITKAQTAQKMADAIQPEIFALQHDVRDAKVQLTATRQEATPIVQRLDHLRRVYQDEEEAERQRIEQIKMASESQGLARHELEKRLIEAQNQLKLELERYELTLAERNMLEETFAEQLATERPLLERQNAENALALRRLAEVASQRSANETFIDEFGASLMTQKTAAAFAVQHQEMAMFAAERQLEQLARQLDQSRRQEAGHVAELRRLLPQHRQLEEELACLDSELRCQRDIRDQQADRLRDLIALSDDYERLKCDLYTRQQLYLRQAHQKTEALRLEYESGVRRNAELRAEYGSCVQRWLAARLKTGGRLLPQLAIRSELAERLQVVRLVRAGVGATDHMLSLRHLFYSGEHERGQARLAELSAAVRGFKSDIQLAAEHVVRAFVGLMKGDVPFVLRPERETDVRQRAAQTDERPPEGDRQTADGERQRRRRELVMKVAELGRADPAGGRLPSVKNGAEKPTRGIGKLASKTRLPKI